MLKKLIKHELHATGRIMLPMLLLVLLTAVGANIAVRSLLDAGFVWFRRLGVLLLIAFVAAIASVSVASLALMIRRFYKNLLRDEGYLMMTLPVSVHAQILAKALTSVIWFAATGLTVAAAMLIIVADVSLVDDCIRAVREVMTLLSDRGLGLSEQAATMIVTALFWLPVLLLLGGVSMCMQFYAAMAIGHSFSSHKGLLSCAAYIAIQVALSALGGAVGRLTVALRLGAWWDRMMAQLSYSGTVHAAMLCAVLITALCAAALHGVTAYCLTRRLNLE